MDLKEKLRLKTANPASAAPVKLAFLGDSVTHGCFEIIEKAAGCFDCVYDQDAVYHNRLRRQLAAVFPNCPATMINAGISGGSAQQGAERVRRDVIEAGPDLAVVCFGLNDALQPDGLEGYRQGLSSIFRQLKEAGIQTLFMTPNMMCTAVSPQIPAGWQRETGEACAAVQCGGTMDRFMDEARRSAPGKSARVRLLRGLEEAGGVGGGYPLPAVQPYQPPHPGDARAVRGPAVRSHHIVRRPVMLRYTGLRLDHGALEGESRRRVTNNPTPFFHGLRRRTEKNGGKPPPGDGFQRKRAAVGQRLDRTGGPGASVCRPPLPAERRIAFTVEIRDACREQSPPASAWFYLSALPGRPANWIAPQEDVPGRPLYFRRRFAVRPGGERGAVHLRPGVPPGRAGRRRLDPDAVLDPAVTRLFQTGFLCISA